MARLVPYATSCCSEPVTLAVPQPKMRPANFTPPSLAMPYLAEHAQVLYRSAAVDSVWPTAAAAQSGSLLTLRGWGFAAGQDAGPGQRGAMWPFSDEGTGVDVDGGSGVDGRGVYSHHINAP